MGTLTHPTISVLQLRRRQSQGARTRFQLELQSQIGMLKDMQLNPPFDDLPSSLAAFDEKKIELYRTMSEGCEAMISGPKPGVDYDAIAAQAPKLTATLDYVDHAIFEATP